jgi:hypothetical protein
LRLAAIKLKNRLTFPKIFVIILIVKGGKNILNETTKVLNETTEVLKNVKVLFKREGTEEVHIFEKARRRPDGKVEELIGNNIFVTWTNATFICGEFIPECIEPPNKISQPTEITLLNF